MLDLHKSNNSEPVNFQKINNNTSAINPKETTKVLQNLFKYQSVHLPSSNNTNLLKFISTSCNKVKNIYDVDRNVDTKAAQISPSKSSNYYQIMNKMRDSNIFTSNSDYPKLNPKFRNLNTSESIITNIPIKKVGESYLFAKAKSSYYGCTTLSNSSWKPQDSIPNLLNYSSVPYSIINPQIKGNSKTRREIISESKFSPINYQKSVCEFTDLIKVSSNNSNKIYIDSLKKDNNIFHVKNEVCNSFGNLSKSYNGLIEKPFYTKKY
jgi:hypothetical protein